MIRTLLALLFSLVFTHYAYSQEKQEATRNTTITKAILGNIIFNDPALSNPTGQSCGSCHDANQHFADPGVTVRDGAVKGALGFRNAPSLKYAMTIPPLSGGNHDEWQGGLFWDGRANTLEEQALGPFFNPLEMNNTQVGLAKALRQSTYIQHFQTLFGENIIKDDAALIAGAAEALAEFQRTDIFAPFDSKFDYVEAGLMAFTEEEEHGKKLFNGGGPGFGNCVDCHSGNYQGKSIFTQYVHHNILVPRNPDLSYYQQPKTVNPDGKKFTDLGLGQNLKITNSSIDGEAARAKGLFRTPSLRNIAETGPYMHNGVFRTLEEVVDFYVEIQRAGPAEVSENQSLLLSTILEFSEADQKALVAFLKTLTDGYPAPKALKDRLRAYQKTLPNNL